MKSNKYRILLLLCIGLSYIISAYRDINSTENTASENSCSFNGEDTTFQNLISKYNSLHQYKDSLFLSKALFEKKETELRSQIDSNNIYLRDLKSADSRENDTARVNLKNKIEGITNILQGLDKQRSNILAQIKKSEKQLEKSKIEYDELVNHIKSKSKELSGGYSINFKGVSYNLFVANNDLHEIQTHWNVTNDKYYNSSIGDVIKLLKLESYIPLMVTNAGMYKTNYEPQGLYIDPIVHSSAKYGYCNERFPLDVRKVSNDNFYLKPNGVFYIDLKGFYHIDTTEEFERIYNRDNVCKYATQSGPMLVINGRIHYLFTDKSKNQKIRNGVGLIDPKHVVFIISNEPTNFYDFAQLFKDIFNCKNALFLDGAISKMYLRDLNPGEKGGDFGPLISVCSKKK